MADVRKWVAFDPVTGRAVVVNEETIEEAVDAAMDAFVEDFPSYVMCEHCESVTLPAVRVWELPEQGYVEFEKQKGWDRNE